MYEDCYWLFLALPRYRKRQTLATGTFLSRERRKRGKRGKREEGSDEQTKCQTLTLDARLGAIAYGNNVSAVRGCNLPG
jgi:hypothetical protein